MNRNEFLSHNVIKKYLNEVNVALSSLPIDEKEEYLSEIKADLIMYSEKISSEVETQNIAEETLKGFLPPKELANGILMEHKKDSSETHKVNLNSMKIFSGFIIASVAALAVPIILGFINFSATLPFMLAIVGVPIWIMTNKRVLWNSFVINHWNKIIKLAQKTILILAFGFFAVRLMIVNEFTTFTVSYTAGYIIFGLIFTSLLRMFSNYKSQNSFSDTDLI